jgi:mRNA interferase MazF
MPNGARGEVWLADLGMAAKARPCLVMSVPTAETDRALVTLVPHTTSTRGSRFEMPTNNKFFRSGAIDAQNLITIPAVKLDRIDSRTGITHPKTVPPICCFARAFSAWKPETGNGSAFDYLSTGVVR